MYGMGIGVAYVSSILGTFNIVLTPDFMFYETAVMLATFLTLGRYLEANAKGRTSEAIRKLVGLQPRKATILGEGPADRGGGRRGHGRRPGLSPAGREGSSRRPGGGGRKLRR